MDEMIMVMKAMLAELQSINEKLDEIKGDGLYCSVTDIYDKLNEIQGDGMYNTLSEVCEKLDSVDSSVGSLETAVFAMS